MFTLDEWNVYSRFEEDLDRTTNCVESFHAHLKIVAGKDHLPIRQLVRILMEENDRICHRADEHLENALPQPKRRRKSLEKRNNLQRLFQLFQDEQIALDDYIFSVAKNNIAI